MPVADSLPKRSTKFVDPLYSHIQEICDAIEELFRRRPRQMAEITGRQP